MKFYKNILLLSCFYLVLFACENSILKWNLPQLASVETADPVKLSSSSVRCSGNVTKDGGSLVSERGICYSTEPSPTITGNKIVAGSGIGTFTATIDGLSQNTVYYFRAYAITKSGVSYGNETVLGKGVLPELKTNPVISITTTSAVCGGSIINTGSSDITEKGICYSTTSGPTISDNKIPSSSGAADFIVNMNELTEATTYFVRAYAVTTTGISYGNEIRFTTASVSIPTVSTTAVSNVTLNSAMSGGNVTADGGHPVTERGICFSTTANPTTSNTKIPSGSGTGSFAANITGLTQGTTYHVRAYAINSAGTSYGNDISFTTTAASLPTVSTTAASSVTLNSAFSGGNVTTDGGNQVTERGICFSTTANPTTSNTKILSGSGTGSFTANITGMTQGTTYHVRAYAINSAGTSYGNDISFTTTAASLPTVTTTAVSSITFNSAISGGNVTADGGSPVSERGICYSTSQNPTISDNKISEGTGIGNFTVNLTGITPGTTYYIRAYAVNSAGTAYGNQANFTTKSIFLATITTSQVTSITNTGAVSGGNITDDGGGSISERGICYKTTPGPVISDNKISSGTGTGVFTTSLTNLSLGTTYYAKAYAVNAAGISYGNEISFTTSSVLTIGINYQGGIIFYLDNTGKHGLIAAPSDQSSDSKWGCSGTSINGSTGTSIGSGLANTTAIINNCSDASAARVCYNLSFGGYTDWYLPSKDELNLMYLNLKDKGIGNFSTADYWSSSQESDKNSWFQSFSSGRSSSKNKNTSMAVRAIRTF